MNQMRELARQIVSYSIEVKSGDRVLIESWDEADDLTEELIRAVYEAGGVPFVDRRNAEVHRCLLMYGTPETFQQWGKKELEKIQGMNGYVAIRKAYNNSELEDVPSEQMALFNRAMEESKKYRMKQTKWCVLRYPSPSMAQMCKMSTQRFRQYYFDTCVMDYALLAKRAQPLEDLLCRTDKVHIIAPGTDLTFSIKGQKGGPSFLNDTGCGHLNLPDGEAASCPIKDSVNGTISYNVPSNYNGTAFSGIRFTFQDGKIVSADCDGVTQKKVLNDILNTDQNSRYIGEFSLGFNPLVCQSIGDILFDEKMWGSLHFTPGRSPSAIHWDLVLSQKAEDGGGELWFDDVLIRKDGVFVTPELIPLNPENLLKELTEKGEVVSENSNPQ